MLYQVVVPLSSLDDLKTAAGRARVRRRVRMKLSEDPKAPKVLPSWLPYRVICVALEEMSHRMYGVEVRLSL